ncbi:SIR2 family protein [Aliarcobacter butzleri]|uniref:SIR2 family protein n=1 Tax=Aliarcobacter butzleri TaxID=28197 RepID=UPI0019187D02|nr:SIR2 family protein [Aliarcobacter butzleri]MCT7562173.1 SIR2 family protein [Aliarcobacter butzleri]MDN5099082.1 SIR2 family protein [Aliarcobacter butzleri]MDN5128375.1 SIR2 family protein [Aliarcobacter butzleri]MDS1370199.1 SIR2 family protein [Aliarcobacter butzleri]
MNIKEFISKYKNHPILFVGTGVSLRYLKNSFSWDGLLSYISFELTNDEEFYLDLKAKCFKNGKYNFEEIANLLEKEFNLQLSKDRDGKFKNINDRFYQSMKDGINLSRFKIFISNILSSLEIKEEKQEELELLKKIRKNIGSIITTNYDMLIEKIFDFSPLIGNDILLSNPYGSVYKIHGCVSNVEKIIITEEDYNNFDKEYDLIRAQLLSLFIHNPIIFIGYRIEDNNVKKILKTIFSYVNPTSELANKIKNNFLLIEHEKGSDNIIVSDYDINMDDTIIRINKLKTDDFQSIYEAISDLQLPISAMDVRKVQNIVKDIYSGGNIKVSITEDLDSLKNEDRILAIGSSKTIKYEFQTAKEMISNYFKIIEEANVQLLSLIDKLSIYSAQYFPIFGFSKINTKIKNSIQLKENQINNIDNTLKNIPDLCKKNHNKIEDIFSDDTIANSNKTKAILWETMNDNISLDDIEEYLRASDLKTTDDKRLLCAYDMKKYK